MLEQRIVLGNDANFAGLHRALEPVHRDAARSGFIQPGDDAEQLRLADTAWPKKTDDLALRAAGTDDVFDLSADMLQDGPAVIFERNILNLQ